MGSVHDDQSNATRVDGANKIKMMQWASVYYVSLVSRVPLNQIVYDRRLQRQSPYATKPVKTAS